MIRQLYYRMNIRDKILFNYLSVIILTVVTLLVLVTAVVSRSVETTADQNTLQMVGQVNMSMENAIKKMENIMDYIAYDRDVMAFLDGDSSQEVLAQTEDFLTNFKRINSEIVGIGIVSNKDSFVSNSMERRSRDTLLTEEWYRAAYKAPEQLHLFSNPIGRNLTYQNTFFSADDVLSISKAINNRMGQVVGVVVIDMNLDTVDRMIEDLVVGKNGFIYVEDSKGDMVYAPVNPVVYRIMPQDFKVNSHASRLNLQGQRYKMMWAESAYTGFRVVGYSH